jgi:dipeptidyl aminopeptidase/acylaminoacyl peptidase
MDRMLKIFVCLAWLCVLASCRQEHAAKKIPLADFFRNPEKTAFRISPDGKFISFLQPYNNRMNVFVQSADGDSALRITSETDANISWYTWVNNSEIIFLKDNGRDSNPQIYAVSKSGRNLRELLPPLKVKMRLINADKPVNNEILIALNNRDSTIFDAYRLNIATGQLKLAEQNPGNIIQWFSDEKGKLRLALAGDGVNETLLYREKEQEAFRAVVTNNFKSNILPVGFCAEKLSCIYALSNINRDKTALVEFDCSTGKESRVIFSHPEVDISEAGYSVKRRKLMFAAFETWKKERHYLDDSVKSIYQFLEKQLPESEVRINDKDFDERRMIIRTFTDRTPGAFYLYSVADQSLKKLSDVNPSLPAGEMAAMKPVTFENRGNRTINGYLTIPKGMDPKKLPVVVIPHGGPAFRNSWGFSSEVQFLANRGYAVFQVNFTGSRGYGKAFWIGGFKKWGTDIQNDITDGVRWLISEGIADPKRIAIYGSGFGGFSALNGLVSHPDLYACGASQSGIINLFTYLKSVPPYYKPTLQMYYEMVGNPEAETDYFRAVSPVFHAASIKDPVLIAQDTRDQRVNVNETNQFVRELKKRKVPVTYIAKENQQYNFRNPENRMEFYRQLEQFFEKNLRK